MLRIRCRYRHNLFTVYSLGLCSRLLSGPKLSDGSKRASESAWQEAEQGSLTVGEHYYILLLKFCSLSVVSRSFFLPSVRRIITISVFRASASVGPRINLALGFPDRRIGCGGEPMIVEVRVII